MSPNIIFEGIEFYNISGWKGQYAISKCGKVYSYYNRNLKSLQKDKDEYLTCSLIREGSSYKSRVRFHRLIATTFIPNPENKPDVNHIDGNKENNSVENLEWVTKSENNKHALETGLRQPTTGKHYSYLTNKDKCEIVRLSESGLSNIEIGKRLNISKVTIGRFLARYKQFGTFALIYKKPKLARQ